MLGIGIVRKLGWERWRGRGGRDRVGVWRVWPIEGELVIVGKQVMRTGVASFEDGRERGLNE